MKNTAWLHSVIRSNALALGAVLVGACGSDVTDGSAGASGTSRGSESGGPAGGGSGQASGASGTGVSGAGVSSAGVSGAVAASGAVSGVASGSVAASGVASGAVAASGTASSSGVASASGVSAVSGASSGAGAIADASVGQQSDASMGGLSKDAGLPDGPAESDVTSEAGADGGGRRSLGCGKTFARPDPSMQQTMQIRGTTRYYLVYIPPTYNPDTAMPVIFAFHGHGMNDVWASMDTSGGFSFKAATANKAILVFPQGTGDPPGNTCVGCSSASINSTWDSSGSDVDFVTAMAASITNTYCVDPHRIFAAGFSIGAIFTNDLGCLKPDLFRAIAPVEGAGPGVGPGSSTSPACSNGSTATIAAVVTHGTNDQVVNYSLGKASADFWRTRDGCGTATQSAMQGCVAYQSCSPGLPVDFCTTSGAHNVPSNGGANIWAFFNSLQ